MIGVLRLLVLLIVSMAGALFAAPDGVFSRLETQGVSIAAGPAGGIVLQFALTQPVPFRVITKDNPKQVIIDTREVDWSNLQSADILTAPQFIDVQSGRMRSGWSRLVLTLSAPLAIEAAHLSTEDTAGAVLTLHLTPTDMNSFAAKASAPKDPRFKLDPPVLAKATPRAAGALHVVLDPGHGGIDPGATQGKIYEADLMLSIAREVKDSLMRAGFTVTLTRDADVFIPLSQRVAAAHSVKADVFISLHADVVSEGQAKGASVYTLAKDASDRASALLAAQHDRDSLLAGVDLHGQKDDVARILMDMARQDTQPRAESLAAHLVAAMAARIDTLPTRPHRHADFSVLRAADIPSVLVEAGFLSNRQDLKNLQDPNWRSLFTQALVEAIEVWADEDKILAPMRRK